MYNVSFSNFDLLASWFWKQSLKQINKTIEEGHIKDYNERSGATLVIGCPLPQEIQQRILAIQSEFDQLLSTEKNPIRVNWRDDLSSLHITVYGLVKPENYETGKSWPLQQNIEERLIDAVSNVLNFDLILQGIGVLLGGTIGIRISNNETLHQIREQISQITGVSEYARDRGESVNKIIIGRFLPQFSESNVQTVREFVTDLKGFYIGKINVTHFKLIHYKHEFLDQLYEQHHFPQ